MKREQITENGKIYVSTERAATAVGLSVWRLRELARGYERKDRTTRTVPCIKEQRRYYFNIEELKAATNYDKRTDPLYGM